MPDFTVSLTDDEIKYLEHDLLDINDWIQKAVRGKINNCLKRLAREERQRLINSGATTMPVKDEDVALGVFQNSSYKNRKEREAARNANNG